MPTNELTPTLEAEPIVDALSTDEASIIETTPTHETWQTSEPIKPIPNVSFDDLLRVVHILARSEKFQLLQFVVAELADAEKNRDILAPVANLETQRITELKAGVEYTLYTPYDQQEAAHTLREAFERTKEQENG